MREKWEVLVLTTHLDIRSNQWFIVYHHTEQKYKLYLQNYLYNNNYNCVRLDGMFYMVQHFWFNRRAPWRLSSSDFGSLSDLWGHQGLSPGVHFIPTLTNQCNKNKNTSTNFKICLIWPLIKPAISYRAGRHYITETVASMTWTLQIIYLSTYIKK